ncbi:MAG: FAD-dependent oxidoreductase [Anaerolineales bacterium]|jgi:glycine/D-amino acid oxidase-like deaminating enzyme
MKSVADVLVVGGGIFGTTGALELQSRGYEVQLVDPGPLPHPQASSTDISKVVRMDYGADEFYMQQMELALGGWREWNRDWQEPLFHETGFLVLTRSRMKVGTYEGDSYALLEKRGHKVERIGVVEVEKRFSAWAPDVYVDGYFNPQGGWAESGRVVARLLKECRLRGVDIQEGVIAQDLLRDGDQVVGVLTNRGELQAGAVVLAMGAWTAGFLPELQGHIWPVAQPVFHFRTRDAVDYQPPGFPTWTADVARTGWYGFPALDDGTLKIANHGPGTRVAPSVDIDVARDREPQFRVFLRQSLPGLADAQVLKRRTCYYADSWDGDFYVTPVPNRERLFVASGGSGHAFKFAPLLGKWIADVFEGRISPALERFSWREPAERETEDARNL